MWDGIKVSGIVELFKVITGWSVTQSEKGGHPVTGYPSLLVPCYGPTCSHQLLKELVTQW